MHCVPVIVKDNLETADMATTTGSLSLKEVTTGKDAFVVKRPRKTSAASSVCPRVRGKPLPD